MTTYRTQWGSDSVEIQADFARAECPVHGTNGRQVADFQHSPTKAMRYALAIAARADGLDPEDEAIDEAIDRAVAEMEEEEEEEEDEPPSRVGYRGANGRWYDDEREARSAYSWSDGGNETP